eukprot:6892436-Heterocapsa_arctica.AAC.1
MAPRIETQVSGRDLTGIHNIILKQWYGDVKRRLPSPNGSTVNTAGRGEEEKEGRRNKGGQEAKAPHSKDPPRPGCKENIIVINRFL